MLSMLCYFFLMFLPLSLSGNEEAFMRDSEESMEFYEAYAKLYDLPANSSLHDITEEVLKNLYVSHSQKEMIKKNQRRIVVFSYPSNGFKIKGVISFVPHPENSPLIVLLRGGHNIFGILSPGSDLVNPAQYTVISTMYRGGVSEGKDEFGGDDVNDVKNLIAFIPTLEKQLKIKIQSNQKYLIGRSRGGMEMFLALKRFPDLQEFFSKVVSLSGVLNMREWISARPEMEDIFAQQFGYQKEQADAWIDPRDPLLIVPYIKKELPILIVQGTADTRVSLANGKKMVSKLQTGGNNVTYWEVAGGEHCLHNILDRSQRILHWLESSF